MNIEKQKHRCVVLEHLIRSKGKDAYTSEILETLKRKLLVVEGTIHPLLTRLKK
jgi:hypothetical protein